VQKLGAGALILRLAAVCVYHISWRLRDAAIEGSEDSLWPAVSTGFLTGLSI